MTLNPNIRRTVALLRANGFDTQDSGDGETHDFGCDLECAYVHCRSSAAALVGDAHRMKSLLEGLGIVFTGLDEHGRGTSIEALFSPVDGLATVSVFGVDDRMIP